MGRSAKARRVCNMPLYVRFEPQPNEAKAPVQMDVEDFECIRLMDYLGMTQEECAEQMGVARTTVQAIYMRARRRLAGALVEGRPLQITGGNFELCSQLAQPCHGNCYMMGSRISTVLPTDSSTDLDLKKGRISMQMAIPYDNGQIFQHFGRSEQFKLYEVTDGAIKASRILENNGAGHGALVTLLQQEHVDVLICGGLGAGAQNALKEAGIRFYGGVQGEADKAAADFVAGRLAYDPAVHCEHHGAGEAHGNCGHHGAGEAHGCHHQA